MRWSTAAWALIVLVSPARANEYAEIDRAAALYAADPVVAVRLGEQGSRLAEVGVDPTVVAELMNRARERSLPPAEVERILRSAWELDAKNLPPWLFVDRYLQGLAKGVPLARIDAVAEALQEQMQRAARTIETVLPPIATMPSKQLEEYGADRLRVIESATYALNSGLPQATFERSLQLAIAEPRPLAEVSAPLLALGFLTAAGLAPDRSFEIVDTAWKHGFRGPALERLGFGLGAIGSEAPGSQAEAVDQLLARLRDGMGPEQLLEILDSMHEAGGRHHPPGSGPGEDPTHRYGPGGHPDDPSHPGHSGGGSGPHGH